MRFFSSSLRCPKLLDTPIRNPPTIKQKRTGKTSVGRFNAGPRICLGQQFAYHETSFFLVRLLQHFSDISLASDAQPPRSLPPKEWAEDPDARKRREKIRPKAHLTMFVQDGLWITMNEAKKAEDL